MTIDEVQKLMPNCKIVPFIDGMYLALPKKQLNKKQRKEQKERIEKLFSIRNNNDD